MSGFLLAIAIGPVQDFIAAARKARDLWCGSWLLSEISKAVAKEVVRAGGTLIFPAPAKAGDLEPWTDFTVVNKLLAVLPDQAMPELSERLRHSAYQRLQGEMDEATRQARRLDVDINQERADRQLRGLMEFYAAWTPLANDYAAARGRVELLLIARKQLRDFPQIPGVAGVPKSSLDGAREDVIVRRGKRVWESRLGRNERLDAIGVIKRYGGHQPPRFDSTTDIAAVPFAAWMRQHRPDHWKKFEELTKDGVNRVSLIYEHESRLEELEQQDPGLAKALAEWRKSLGRKPGPPYYGLLIGDGDRMGSVIESIRQTEEHERFSRRLSKFAGSVAPIIARHEGCQIFAGGDDVLALLPLHTALHCVQDVNEAFGMEMQGFSPQPTFSAGLAVVHALDPLSEARKWAHEAEQAAKNRYGRNALAIAVVPRSGEPVIGGGNWTDFPALVNRVLDGYSSRNLSPSFAHELQELMRRTPQQIDDMLVLMAQALAKKKKEHEMAAALVEGCQTRHQLAEVVNAMLVARPFWRAQKEASG